MTINRGDAEPTARTRHREYYVFMMNAKI